jgi:sulfite reductase (NADPH) flavoprotein alpha-component
MTVPSVPSRRVLEEVERINIERGHEVGGFVSLSHGFIPKNPPKQVLPESHRVWDEVALSLPELYRTVKVRDALDAMPILPATVDALPDEHLLRALSILSIFAHAWVRIEMTPAGDIPPPVLEPWTEATRRIGRREAFMQYNDLILTNWRQHDPGASDPMAIENLELLIPTVGNQTERVFYLTQIEMTARAAPLVGAVVRAQEAIAADDVAGVKAELLLMLDVLRALVEDSFVKIDPNPLAATHCDPVIWGTTVAPFAVSLDERIPGPGGTANPVFHLMDSFLGRKEYGSQLGQEASNLRLVAPPLQQDFIRAIAETSLPGFLEKAKSRSLSGLVQTISDAYAGDSGIIAAHRMKAYGFLEVAFKVGRSVTIGGFKGVFRERPWKLVDSELNITRMERGVGATQHLHRAAVADRTSPSVDQPDEVAQVSLDIGGRGIVYHPGDRCGVLPVADQALVSRTLEALDADPDTMVPLTPLWVSALEARAGFEGATEIRLEDFLRFAKVRPVLRPTAKALWAVTVSPRLGEIVESRQEDLWELWDLLELVHADGYDVSRLWSSQIWQSEAIAQIVPPETFRMYSVSSAPDLDDDALPKHLDLTVGALAYEANGVLRQGNASTYLTRNAPATEDAVPVRIVHPRRFRLPKDPGRPIVMFAAGTGIAPFRGFVHARAQQEGAGESLLYAAHRDRSRLLYQSEFDQYVADGKLSMRIALADEGTMLEDVMSEPDNAAQLRRLIVDEGAAVYLCGRPGFANSVLAVLSSLVGRDSVRQLVADRRLMLDIFTAFAPVTAQPDDAGLFDASDVVLHNDDERGWWIVVDGMVYDLTEFVHLHPGGKKIIVESAGMDASREYRSVLHHENSEIEAMLSMYRIGAVRRLRFDNEWGIVLTPDGFQYLSLHDAYRAWVKFLYLVVEMQNALANDFTYMRMQTVVGEDPDALSPLKLMLFGNTHLRFFDHYFHGSLSEDLHMLWAITTGMGAPTEPLRGLETALGAVTGSADAKTADAFGERLRGVYREARERLDDAAYWSQVRGLCDAVEAADRGFLEAMKAALRDGVKVFERLEADTMRSGGPELVATLLRVPDIAAAYYADLLARIRAVDPALA